MKKAFIFLLLFTVTGIFAERAKAQLVIAEIIKAGIKKVIKAVDLKVQRLQNETIWLQNAQKTLENAMSKLKLEEISGWTEKQRTLYKDYFEELNKVKSLIAYYNRIKDIGQKQGRLITAYHKAWDLLQQDQHFAPEELRYMGKVYSGILQESLENIDQVLLVLRSFDTQMSDAKRLEIIRQAADRSDQNYYDLLQFNQRSILLSLNRAKDLNDALVVRNLYGLNQIQ